MLEENLLNSKISSTPPVAHTPLYSSLKLDYQKLASQLILALRGELTQRQVSQLLGYSFNQVGKWESGATHIKWSDFLRLCEVLNVPLEKHFKFLFWTFEAEFNSLTSLQALDRALNFFEEEKENHPSVKKWLTGQMVPDLSDVLRILGKKSAILFGLLSLFVNCEKVELIKDAYQEFLLTIDSVLDDPVVVYVNTALSLDEYKKLEFHDEKLLAEHSACSVERLRHALDNLTAHGLIEFDGKKYHPNPFDFSFSGLRHYKLRGLTKHTTQLAAERYSVTPISNNPAKVKTVGQGSTRVTALSKDAARKVADLISKFHIEVGEIVKQDQLPKDNVQVILVHSFASNINAKQD